METTVSPQHADLRSDAKAIPLVPQDERGPQDALAKLAEEAARATAHLRPAAAVNFSAGPRVAVPSPDPVRALRSGEALAAEPAPAPRRSGRSLLRFALAVTVGVAATLAWQSYGEAARQMIAAYVPALAAPAPAPMAAETPASTGAGRDSDHAATAAAVETAQAPVTAADSPAPPAAPQGPTAAELAQQIATMSHDLAALRDSVDKVAAAQDHMGRAVARLQDADEEAARKPPLPRPAPARKPAASRQAPPPAPPPVAQAAPQPPAPAVTSAPLPPLTAPLPSPVPELNRRPPASMP